MRWKAVIFDLDGTLLDTIGDIADSMNAVLRSGGYPVHSDEEYKRMVGEGLAVLVRRALPQSEQADPVTLGRVTAAMKQEYAGRLSRKTCPYAGVIDLLQTLFERRVPAAVLSNKPHEATVAIVKEYFGRWPFFVVLGASDDYPRKPDPAGAFIIAEKLGLSPAEILYVGDTDIDMQTASAAGMYAVGAGWGFRPVAELWENGAKVVIAHPLELLGILYDPSGHWDCEIPSN